MNNHQAPHFDTFLRVIFVDTHLSWYLLQIWNIKSWDVWLSDHYFSGLLQDACHVFKKKKKKVVHFFLYNFLYFWAWSTLDECSCGSVVEHCVSSAKSYLCHFNSQTSGRKDNRGKKRHIRCRNMKEKLYWRIQRETVQHQSREIRRSERGLYVWQKKHSW